MKVKRRVCSAALTLAMTLSLLVTMVLPAGAVDYAGGSGTRNDPYLIATAQQLKNFRDQVKSLPAIIGAFFTEIGNFGASEMTAGLGFTYVFAMIIAGFAGCLVIRNTIAMTQNIKLRYFAYYSFIVGIITLALNFAL